MPLTPPKAPREPSRTDALEGLRTFLEYIGENTERAGLRETPERVLKAWEEYWGAGYDTINPDDLLKLFDLSNAEAPEGFMGHINEMVVERNIDFYSHCEHHLAPFFGKVAIAYIPQNSKVLGLSKFARVVDHFSRRLQVQERMTNEIADFLAINVSRHVAVRAVGTHLCMSSRGVQQAHAETITTALRGDFYADPQTRAEFLQNL